MDLKKLGLDDYQSITYDKVRYRDTDKQGHVNNAVYGQFFETGRVEILYNTLSPLQCEHCSFVIASKNTDYIEEINWPGTVDIGTAVTKIGHSSLMMVQGLFQDKVLKATSETVIVQMDEHTRKSYALTKGAREKLNRLMIDYA